LEELIFEEKLSLIWRERVEITSDLRGRPEIENQKSKSEDEEM
jgi:hypothetical protein